MGTPTASLRRPIKLGVVADLTGPMSFMGIADANVARMVVDEINAADGLLGQHIELHIKDSETTDEAAEAAAAKLVQDVQVDVIFGGILSSTRQAIKAAAVTEGRTLYIYPEQYEGQECDPLIFCTGPVPAQQVDPLIPWLIERTGAKRFALPSADYIWPRIMNEKVRQIVTAAGGEIVEEDYYPLDHTDYSDAIEKIMSGGAEVVFNTIVPPAMVPFFQQLHDAGFRERGGQLVCTYFDENCVNLVPAEQVEGLYSCLDYYRDSEDPFSRELLDRYDKRYPGGELFTGGGACSGMDRGLRLWEAAIREAGSLDQGEVIEALDHAKIAVGPGGPAEMVPGQHHVRMNMFIGQVQGGAVRTIKRLGVIDPDEQIVPAAPLARV
jgi:ABC-type branched-subunit amino acid transport system substrate-binding protein